MQLFQSRLPSPLGDLLLVTDAERARGRHGNILAIAVGSAAIGRQRRFLVHVVVVEQVDHPRRARDEGLRAAVAIVDDEGRVFEFVQVDRCHLLPPLR